MSVSVIIINPENDKEKQVNVPIATELFFRNQWLPLIKQMDLKWLNCFQSGIEISYEDKDDVIKELEELKKKLLSETKMGDDYLFMIRRIDNLIIEIKGIFDRRKDTILYIG